MLTAQVALLFLAVLLPQQSDTTVAVPAGTRLFVETGAGSIVVDTWAREEVRVQATHGSRDRISVEMRGSVVSIHTERPGGIPAASREQGRGQRALARASVGGVVDYRITVPITMDLELGGIYTDIVVEGTSGQVVANTVDGDITVRGRVEQARLQSVNGSVSVEGARGPVGVQSVGGGVRIREVQGRVDAQTVSGSLVMEDIQSTDLAASSVSGSVYFDGTIAENGRYTFTTHSGRVTVAVPESLNATVSVALINGSFSSSLPSLANATTERGRRQSFTVGTGSAILEVETFSGLIRIVRSGEVTP